MTKKLGVFVMLALAPAAAWSITQEAGEDSAVKADESVAEKDEPVVTPSPWAARKYAVGIGYSGSTVDTDVPRGVQEEITFDGWSVFGRIGLSDRWGLQFGYRSMKDDENFDPREDISLDMVGVHAYWVWAETEYSRWHVKFGLAWMDFESKIPSVNTFTDHALGPSIGTGFEWGTPRLALFIDFGLTFADIELVPGAEESFLVGNTISGLIYKF